jgi:hypothetical protein
MPIPVAARSNVLVYVSSIVLGIAGSNPAGSMEACLLEVLCVAK